MRAGWITAVIGLWALGSACSKECSSSADCGGNRMCTLDGECVPRSVVDVTCDNPDGCAPPDAGVRDSGPERDGGLCLDDGGPCDAGFRDGGSRDGGVGGGDAGFIDAAVTGARATLFIREQTAGANQSDYQVYAELVDESGAAYDETLTSYVDVDGNVCDLTVRRLASGAPQPLLTDRIEIELGGSLPTIVLTHTANGRYEPAPNTTFRYRMFAQANNPSVALIAGPGGAVFTAGSVPIPVPIETLALIPAAGASTSIANSISWNVTPQAVPVVVEASDRDREVVLTCRPFNDGGYTIPFDARQGWSNATPTAPSRLEIRRNREASAQALVPGVGYVPMTIQTSWGPVFRLTP